jgi:hypothetical protein
VAQRETLIERQVSVLRRRLPDPVVGWTSITLPPRVVPPLAWAEDLNTEGHAAVLLSFVLGRRHSVFEIRHAARDGIETHIRSRAPINRWRRACVL